MYEIAKQELVLNLGIVDKDHYYAVHDNAQLIERFKEALAIEYKFRAEKPILEELAQLEALEEKLMTREERKAKIEDKKQELLNKLGK